MEITFGPRRVSQFRAVPYPGEIPDFPFLIEDGWVIPLSTLGDQFWARYLQKQSAPLMAYGSNASPARLQEKFGYDLDDLLVINGTMIGAERVFACARTRRGVVPYSLIDAPGHQEAAYLILVPARLCSRMDLTEGRGNPYYKLARMTRARLDVGGCRWNHPVTYLGHGQRGPAVYINAPFSALDHGPDEASKLVDQFRGDDSLLPPHAVIPLELSLLKAARRKDDLAFLAAVRASLQAGLIYEQ